MLKKNSGLWWLAVPLAVLGSAYLASLLRAPGASAEPLKLGTVVDLSFKGLANAAVQSGEFRIAPDDYTLVSFGYTSCPDLCPTTLLAIHEVLEKLGPDARRVKAVFISVDPERDTAVRLAGYTRAFDPRIVALTGPADAIASTAAQFHIRYVKREPEAGSTDYAIDHTAVMYLIDPRRRVAAAIPESGPARDVAASVLRRIQRHEGPA